MPEVFTPAEGKLLIKPDRVPEKTKGGIILPATAENSHRPLRGTVVAVGPGIRDPRTGHVTECLYKVGDKLVYGRWAGTEVNCSDDKYFLINSGDVQGVVTGEPDEENFGSWGTYIQ